jgi:hypothetical protein
MENESKVGQILSSLCEQAAQLLQAEIASIWLLDGDKVVLQSAIGALSGIKQDTVFYKIGEGLTGYIAQGNAFRGSFNDIRQNVYWRGKYDVINYPMGGVSRPLNFLGVPIKIDERVIGVLKVENKKKDSDFTESDQTLLETMASLIANAVSSESAIIEAKGPYLFVLMPFAQEFSDIYEYGIKACAEKMGCRCERVDEIEFNDRILDEIYRGIQRADLLIADMTGKNPNVFYEVGYAHALSKEVVLLSKDSADIPFDLKGHNFVVYSNSIKKLTNKLERRLTKFLEEFRTNEDN